MCWPVLPVGFCRTTVCGLTGEEVYPDDAVGTVIFVTYGRTAQGRLDVVSFTPVPTEVGNDTAD